MLRYNEDGRLHRAGPTLNTKIDYTAGRQGHELGRWMRREGIVLSTLSRSGLEKPIAYFVRTSAQVAAFYASCRRVGRDGYLHNTTPTRRGVCLEQLVDRRLSFAMGMLIASICNWLRTSRKPRTTVRLIQTDFNELAYYATTSPGCLHVRRKCATLDNRAIQERKICQRCG